MEGEQFGVHFGGACSICFEERELSSIPGCEHYFCKECINGYIMATISMNINTENEIKIKCLEGNCESHLTDKTIEHYLTSEEYSHYQNIQNKKNILRDKNKKLCPTVDCTGILERKQELNEEKSQKIACNICEHDFCFDCLRAFHEGSSCDEYFALLSKKNLLSRDELNFIDFLENDKSTKPCPKCRVCFLSNFHLQIFFNS